MRETKFRGKRKDGGGWVDGDLIHYEKNDYRILEQFDGAWDILETGFEVIPESVGQFTGLKDKNDKEIYEGDICEAEYSDFEGNRGGSQKGIGQVYWDDHRGFDLVGKVKNIENLPGCKAIGVCPVQLMGHRENDGERWGYSIEIIGNIHDNPELMEERL